MLNKSAANEELLEAENLKIQLHRLKQWIK